MSREGTFMRLVVARCSVVYEGRLDTSLPEATRLLLVKADGSISIHAVVHKYMVALAKIIVEADHVTM